MFGKAIGILLLLILQFKSANSQCSGPASLPYFEGFENQLTDSTPQCFTTETVYNTILSAKVANNVVSAFQGSKYLGIGNGSLAAYTSCYGWLFLPAMDFVPGKNYNLSFQYRGYNNLPNNDYPFEVFYGTAPNAASMTRIVGSTKFWPNNYTAFNAAFSPIAGEKFIGIHYRSSPDYGNALYIDNISITETTAPPCNNLTATITAPCCIGGAITANTNFGINKINWYRNGSLFFSQNGVANSANTLAGGNGSGDAANQLNAPFSVFLDAAKNVYVADAANNRIQKFAPGSTTGVTVAGGNGSGVAANQLNNPRGVFVDASGNIYVADAGNNRIQKWAVAATSGITVAGGNGQGNAANQLDFPHCIFVDAAGKMYIADGNNNRVQRWLPNSTTGITVAGGNGAGSGTNQLSYVTGLFADATGNVYVTDFSNNRVMRWGPLSLNGFLAAGGNGAGNEAGFLNAPRGLFVDCSGNVYVADQNNHRIQKWAPGATLGVTVAGGNGAGSAANQLNSPAALYVDNNGNILVADRLNHRIQQFTLGNTATYTPTIPGAYTAIISGTGCCTATTLPVIINAANTPNICPGSSTYFVSGNSASGNTYQWQVNTGSGLVNIGNTTTYSGALSDTLQLQIPSTSWYGNKYRCLINGAVYSPEYTLKFTINWTGNTSNAWENANNWSCGILPDEFTDVVIETGAYNYPFVNANAACGSLKLMPGSTVTVKTGMKLDVKRK